MGDPRRWPGAAACGPPPAVLLRGRLHQACAVLAVPAAVRVVRAARTPVARRAARSYAAGLVGVFTVSAAYHRGRWSAPTRRRLKTLDHAAIFAFSAVSYAPLTLVLPPRQRRRVLGTAGCGAVVGSVLKARRLDEAGGPVDALYLVVGWAGLLVLPSLVAALSASQLALLLGGGVVYTAGALVLVRRWPDPVPAVFGYHARHLVMLGGTVLHYALDLQVLEAT